MDIDFRAAYQTSKNTLEAKAAASSDSHLVSGVKANDKRSVGNGNDEVVISTRATGAQALCE